MIQLRSRNNHRVPQVPRIWGPGIAILLTASLSVSIATAQQTRTEAEKDPVLKAMLIEMDRSKAGLQLQGFQKPFFIGVTLRNIILESEKQPTLFGDPDNRMGLSATMDKLNLKYGHTTLHFAGMLPAREAAPTRIAFTAIPVLYGVDYI